MGSFLYAAATGWPEAAVMIAVFVCLTIAWCALMWALAHDGQRTSETARQDTSPPKWATSTTRAADDEGGAS